MNLQVIFQQACLRWADHIGLIDGERTITYGELFRLSERAAAALVASAGREFPKVALLLGNRWEYLVLDMACAYCGAALVRLNARDEAREIAYVLEDFGAECLVYGAEFEATVQAALARIDAAGLKRISLPPAGAPEAKAAFDIAFGSQGAWTRRPLTAKTPYRIMYTSGTTGSPKGVIVTHDQWCCAVLQNLFLGPLADVTPDDCFLHVTPLTHVSGGLFWPFMLRGARQVVCAETSVEAIVAEIAAWKVTRTFLVPTMVSKLVSATPEQQQILRGLTRIYYAASPIGMQTLKTAVGLYGSIFAQGYGSTESMWWLTFFYPEEHEAALRAGNVERLSSCGRPSLGVELMIVDDAGRQVGPGEIGEVVSRGRHVAKAYLNRGEVPRDANIGDGWFRLGDIGYADKDGFFYLIDRKNNLIITGGFNVYPAEVESVLSTCPGVSECCVIGAPDEHWGEVIVAVVVKVPSATLTAENILDFGKAELPDYKRPRRVIFANELPVNSGGKIDRRALREELWSDRERRI